jgi:hypothetical protein
MFQPAQSDAGWSMARGIIQTYSCVLTSEPGKHAETQDCRYPYTG